MGTLTASYLIAQASETAQDEANVQWTAAQSLEWLNDAQRAVAMARPDASTLTHSVTLVAGTQQTITGLRFMTAIRNMGADGVTPGRAIRLVERGAKDESDPYWHAETASTEVLEVIFDARTPKIFYASPPIPNSPVVQIEISEAVNPANVADVGDPITLDDIYSSAMIEWILYRFFSRDSEETPNIQRAISHFQAFFNLLQTKLQVDMAINPKIRAHLE